MFLPKCYTECKGRESERERQEHPVIVQRTYNNFYKNKLEKPTTTLYINLDLLKIELCLRNVTYI